MAVHMKDFFTRRIIDYLFTTEKLIVLLAESHCKVYEVADMIGYTSQTNVGRNFDKQFGTTPTDYQKRKMQKGYVQAIKPAFFYRSLKAASQPGLICFPALYKRPTTFSCN